MAKWDADKLDEAFKKAEKEDKIPPVPVRTPRLTNEEKLRRYEKE